jgi:hypothetical protein
MLHENDPDLAQPLLLHSETKVNANALAQAQLNQTSPTSSSQESQHEIPRRRFYNPYAVFTSSRFLSSMVRVFLISPSIFFLAFLLLLPPHLRSSATNNTILWVVTGLSIGCWVTSRYLQGVWKKPVPHWNTVVAFEFGIVLCCVVANSVLITSTTIHNLNSITLRSLGLFSLGMPGGVLFFGFIAHYGLEQVMNAQKEAFSGFVFSTVVKHVIIWFSFMSTMVIYTENTMGNTFIDLDNMEIFVKTAMNGKFSCQNVSLFHLPQRHELTCPPKSVWCGYDTPESACWAIGMAPVVQSFHYDIITILFITGFYTIAHTVLIGRGVIKMTPDGGLDNATKLFLKRPLMILAGLAFVLVLVMVFYHAARIFLNGNLLSIASTARLMANGSPLNPPHFVYPSSCVGDCDTYLFYFFGWCAGSVVFLMSVEVIDELVICSVVIVDNKKFHSSLALGAMKQGDLVTSLEKEIILNKLDEFVNNPNSKAAEVVANNLLDPNKETKFAAKELISGIVSDAANGLASFMCVDSSVLQQNVYGSNGELAIKQEVEATGDLELRKHWNYVVNEKSEEKKFDNGIRDSGRGGVTIEHFMQHPNVERAKLERGHVIALRLYTTHAYKFINDPLRDPDRVNRKEPHPLPATVALISDGIKKLRAVADESSGSGVSLTLWRGLKNIYVSRSFANNGGTEKAPMSTTSDLAVAVKYAIGSGDNLLFKIKVPNALKLGADLEWLTAFPGEREVLYPPLTYLQPTQQIQIFKKNGASVTVIEVEPDLSA